MRMLHKLENTIQILFVAKKKKMKQWNILA